MFRMCDRETRNRSPLPINLNVDNAEYCFIENIYVGLYENRMSNIEPINKIALSVFEY